MCKRARIVLRVRRQLGKGDVAGCLEEFLELPVRNRRAVHPERVHRDAVDRRLFRIVLVRAHAKGAAGKCAPSQLGRSAQASHFYHPHLAECYGATSVSPVPFRAAPYWRLDLTNPGKLLDQKLPLALFDHTLEQLPARSNICLNKNGSIAFRKLMQALLEVQSHARYRTFDGSKPNVDLFICWPERVRNCDTASQSAPCVCSESVHRSALSGDCGSGPSLQNVFARLEAATHIHTATDRAGRHVQATAPMKTIIFLIISISIIFLDVRVCLLAKHASYVDKRLIRGAIVGPRELYRCQNTIVMPTTNRTPAASVRISMASKCRTYLLRRCLIFILGMTRIFYMRQCFFFRTFINRAFYARRLKPMAVFIEWPVSVRLLL